MITIFACPKRFAPPFDTIQHNAIRSWALLRPRPEVILFGEDDGVAGCAAALGLRHIAEVARSAQGTPLLSDMFRRARLEARHRLLCYVNADIILMGDLPAALRRAAALPRFLMVGQRLDLNLRERLRFEPGWEARLRERALRGGALHGPTGIDYVAFPRGLDLAMPDFAVGRPGWDNWTIYRARAMGVPVVDATRAVLAVHQNHDYSHHALGYDGVWAGPEARRNIELMGDWGRVFSIDDASWLLTRRWLLPALTPAHLRRRRQTLRTLHPRLHAGLRRARDLLRVGRRALGAGGPPQRG